MKVTVRAGAMWRIGLGVFVALCSGSLVRAQPPEGDEGIARRYPGDVGIAGDPAVLFAEDFEEGTLTGATDRWDDVRSATILSLTSEVPPGSSGTASLLIHKQPGDGSGGGHLYRRVLPDGGGLGYTELYTRMYVRIGAESDPIHHFGTNLGGLNPPSRWPIVSAGNRTSGDRSFWSGIEPYGDSWRWDFYTYWMEMRSWQNPDGTGSEFWGNSFLRGTSAESWAPVGPEVRRGEWTCLEMMIRVNDPVSGLSGAQAFWVDGQLVRRNGQVISYLEPGTPNGSWLRDKWSPDPGGTPFEGFRWRSSPDLLVNYVWLYVYTEEDSYDIPVWFDDVVVATSYIGPLAGSGPPPPRDGGVSVDGGAALDGGAAPDGGRADGSVPPGSDGGPSTRMDGGGTVSTTDGGCGCGMAGGTSRGGLLAGFLFALVCRRRGS